MERLDYNSLPQPTLGQTVLTIGNFDGVHRGHQELIRTTVAEARQNNLTSVLLTFYPHPVTFFLPGSNIQTICSQQYKEKLIAMLDIDAMITLTFDEKFASLSPEDYVKNILIDKLNIATIWVGYDFNFGRNRSGNVRNLIEMGELWGFKTRVLSPQRNDGIVISSTKIRELILTGNTQEANHYLNRVHIITGSVVSGDERGRSLGYPTINIDVQEGLIPANGIYSSIIEIDSRHYPAATYIGRRPTFGDPSFRVEAHIIGFSGNLYHQRISVGFLNFIRPDAEFENSKQLAHAIANDCKVTQRDFDLYEGDANKLPFII